MAVPKWIDAEIRRLLSQTVGDQWQLNGSIHVSGDLHLRLHEAAPGRRVTWVRITREALRDDFISEGRRSFTRAGRELLRRHFTDRLPTATDDEQIILTGDA